MKMEEMKAYFERKGFECEYKYFANRNAYEFVITKNNFSRLDSYKWPESQMAFMKELISHWERDYRKHTECKYPAQGTIDDLSRAMYKGVNFATVRIDNKEYPVRLSNVTLDRRLCEEEAHIECEVMSEAPQIDGVYWSPYAMPGTPQIKNVIHNEPATIVFWSDGTKTVVKCQDDDIYDPEKGLAMAICKKVFGNKGNYCNEIKKWLPKVYKDFGVSIAAIERSLKECKRRLLINEAFEMLSEVSSNTKSLKQEYIDTVEDAVCLLAQALED